MRKLTFVIGFSVLWIAKTTYSYQMGKCVLEGGIKGWRVKYYSIEVPGKSCDTLTESEIENLNNWKYTNFSGSEIVGGKWGSSFPPDFSETKEDCFGVEYGTFIKVEDDTTYRFCAKADDGVEVYVDGARYPFKNAIGQDCFTIKGEEECITDPISLTPGYHYLMVRYYESTGTASLSLGVQSGGTCVYPFKPANSIRSGGVWAFYYSSTYPGFFTSLKAERRELTIDHNWGEGGPEGVSANLFAGRFITNLFITSPDVYRFCFQYDDGIRVYLNGSLVYEDWNERSSVAEYSLPDLSFISGFHELVVEFFEGFENATLRVGYGPDCDGDPNTFTPLPDNMYAIPKVRCAYPGGVVAGCSYSSHIEYSLIFSLFVVLIFFIAGTRFRRMLKD